MSRLRSPVLLILALAPLLGECTSGATPPLDLLLSCNLALFVVLPRQVDRLEADE